VSVSKGGKKGGGQMRRRIPLGGGVKEFKDSPVAVVGVGGSGQTTAGTEESRAPAPSLSRASHLARRESPSLLVSGRAVFLRIEKSLNRKSAVGGKLGMRSQEAPGMIKGKTGDPHFSFRLVEAGSSGIFPSDRRRPGHLGFEARA